ncbi:hypothetical protein GCM10025868_04990 [Angustibacter aerolatus]|uniref:Coproheme decarboxylase n=1 Tax=Angustibacter aerolatus TaxID=1162965 RepID=A0ABQ6JDK6_9ACTN|nr:chlorite dismutase family protein [Angustibacter aerolatus]GMA85249.1 hypothetical protein GCM10025868_04990 [Angustibacter aerolatus]
MSEQTDQKPKARDINDTIRYAMWSVFAAPQPVQGDRAALAAEVEALLAEARRRGARGARLVRRGRAARRRRPDGVVARPDRRDRPARLPAVAAQRAGRRLLPVWSNVALHRPAEFNKGHVPAFMAGEEARAYVCVYPFVRSYEWYLLPDAERRDMLVEHGKAARGYPDVRANTVSSFALGDYEWVLAFEADEPAPHRRPHARPAGDRRPPARPRGDPVLHRSPRGPAGPGRAPALSGQAFGRSVIETLLMQ